MNTLQNIKKETGFTGGRYYTTESVNEFWKVIEQSLIKERNRLLEEVKKLKTKQTDIDKLAEQGFGADANGCRDRNEIIDEILEELK